MSTPMTKTAARAFLRRAREGLRDAEQALREGDLDALREALVEVTGSAACRRCVKIAAAS